MTGTVIVRLEAIKTTGNLTHDLDNSLRPNYVDHSRSHLNKIVMGQKFKESKYLFKHQKKNVIQHFNAEKARLRELITPENLDEQEYIKERRRIRNWQSHMKSHLSGFIGFGHDAQANSLSHQLIDECAQAYVEKLCERHNLQMLYLVRHMDETTVHYHFVTTNYNLDSHQTLRLTRDDLRKEQDYIGQAFTSLGLTRGKDKQKRLKEAAQKLNQTLKEGKYSAEVWKQSNVIHRSVKTLHEDLPLEIEAKQQEIDQIQSEIGAKQQEIHQIQSEIGAQKTKLEKNQRLIEQNEAQLMRLSIKEASDRVKIEKIEKRLKSYTKRVNDAQAEIDRLSLDFKKLEGTPIEYVPGHEKKANEYYKAVRAKELKLEQEQRRLKQQRQQVQAEQLQAEAELQAFFARQSYKQMMVFGKPLDSNEELLDFIKWFDQDTGWVTTSIGTRFKVQEENRQVVRVVVENTEGKTNYEKAYTLLMATHKSKLDKGYFSGSDDVFIEFYKLINKEPEKYEFELFFTSEQKELLVKKGFVSSIENDSQNEMNL